jgi:thioredoxin 1
MKKIHTIISILIVLVLSSVFFPGSPRDLLADPDKPPDGPVKGMVTMIDLGSNTCIPCKMMAPILEKLEKDYRGRAAIIVIDVGKHQSQTEKYRIRAIPTQIFYDKEGKEKYRHVGFMSENAIVTQLMKMGVN